MQHLGILKQEKSLFFSILFFMSNWNFTLSWVTHEKKFYNLVISDLGFTLTVIIEVAYISVRNIDMCLFVFLLELGGF